MNQKIFFLLTSLISLSLVAQQEAPKTLRKIIGLRLPRVEVTLEDGKKMQVDQGTRVLACNVPLSQDGLLSNEAIKQAVFKECNEIPIDQMSVEPATHNFALVVLKSSDADKFLLTEDSRIVISKKHGLNQVSPKTQQQLTEPSIDDDVEITV